MNEKDKSAGGIVICFAGAASSIVAPSGFGKLTAATVAALCAIGWVYVEPAAELPSRDVAVSVPTIAVTVSI